jgi:pyruvate/2-oxoacid:ferredoxin oxidoreductase beta subunit
MKKGIIILFSEDEKKIDKHQLANIFNHKDVRLCYVNNGSKDRTLQVLESVKEELEINTISIIDIKKNIPTSAAVKAATRYLKNVEDVKCILYFKSSKLTYFEDKKIQFEILKKIDCRFEKLLPLKTTRRNLKNIFSYKDVLSF